MADGHGWTKLPRRSPGPSLTERARALDRFLAMPASKLPCARARAAGVERPRHTQPSLSPGVRGAACDATCAATGKTNTEGSLRLDQLQRRWEHPVLQQKEHGGSKSQEGKVSTAASACFSSSGASVCVSHPSSNTTISRVAAGDETLATVPRARHWASQQEAFKAGVLKDLQVAATRLVVEEERAWQKFKFSSERQLASRHDIAQRSRSPRSHPWEAPLWTEMLSQQDFPRRLSFGAANGKEELLERGRRTCRWRAMASRTLSAAGGLVVAALHDRTRRLRLGVTALALHLADCCTTCEALNRRAKRLIERSLTKLALHAAVCFERRLVVAAAEKRRVVKYLAYWMDFVHERQVAADLMLRQRHRIVSSYFVAWGVEDRLQSHRRWKLLESGLMKLSLHTAARFEERKRRRCCSRALCAWYTAAIPISALTPAGPRCTRPCTVSLSRLDPAACAPEGAFRREEGQLEIWQRQLWEVRLSTEQQRDGYGRLRRAPPGRSQRACSIAARILQARLSLAALND